MMEKERMDRKTLLRWAAERHARSVYNLCLGVLCDPADAEIAAGGEELSLLSYPAPGR